jgi:diguanylate cyclase (GGDEF)-like protein
MSPAALSRLLLAATVIVVLGFSATCGAVLWDMRRGDERLARESLDNLATTIDAEIARNLDIYDLGLRGVVSNINLPILDNVSRPMRQLVLFDQTATARYFGAIQVMNAAGDVEIDSSTLDPVHANHAVDEFFSVHRRDPLFGLYISAPMMHGGVHGMVLSRRLSNRDGSFRGVVAGFIQSSYFSELIGRLQLDPQDVIAVIRQDGLALVRHPDAPNVVGANIKNSPGVQRVLSSLSGSYVGSANVDKIERLYVWRDGSHPMIVIVGRATEAILRRWRSKALQIVGAMAFLGLFVCGGMMLLVGQMKKRARAEKQLARLAMTDGLTGLSNRRHFDEMSQLEWRRAERAQLSVVLMMIDVDHFKAFNDLHGHQAGDAALVCIAARIAKFARRSGDCAARYGGEEFALLLPNLGFNEAMDRAESIRADVASDVQHQLTVSIGIASLRPPRDSMFSDLIEIADERLYRAKAIGRNQIYARARTKARPTAPTGPDGGILVG